MALTSNVEIVNSLATNTVEDATDNINSGAAAGMPPDSYEEMKDQMKPVEEEVSQYPSNTDPVVADSIGKGRNVASVVKTDTPSLNRFTEYADYIGGMVTGKSTQRDVNDLNATLSRGGELSDEEQSTLDEGTYQLNQTQIKNKDRGFTESVPGHAAGLVYNVGLMMVDQAPIILGSTATLGAAGMLLGSFAPGAGTLAGGIVGAVKGFGVGMTGVFLYDAYNQGTGGVYGELVNEEMPETDRRVIANGAGVLMGAAAILPGLVYAKATPWLMKWIRPQAYTKALSKTLNTPNEKAMMSLTRALGTSMMAEGGEEGVQESIQILAENLGKTYNGTESDFMAAVEKSVTDINNLKRVGQSMALGAIGGGIFTGTARGIGAGAQAISDAVSGKKSPVDTGPRDVTDTVPRGEPGQLLLEAPVPSVTDIVGDNPNLPTVVKGTNAVHVKIALEQMSVETKDTNTNQNIPDEMDIIRQNKFDNINMGDFFVDKEALKKWSDTEEKGAAARAVIDKSGVAAAEMNSPIRLDAFKMFQLLDIYPDIADIIKTTPEGVSFNDYVAQLKEADETRGEFLGEIPARESQPGVREPLTDKEIFETKNISEEDRSALKVLRKESKGLQSEINARVEPSQKLVDGLPKEGDLTDEQKGILKNHNKLLKERDQLARHIKSKVRNVLVKYHPGAQPRLRDQDIFNESDYLNQPTLTTEMLDHLPESKVAKMVEGERQAREAVGKAIITDNNKRMNKIVDLQTETQLLFERESAAENIDNDPNIDFIEGYLNVSVVDGQKVVGGRPVHQINPDTLTARQRSKYLEHEVLAARQVFDKKNGVDVKSVARLFNRSPEDLLSTLANTPDKAQAIENAIDSRRADIEMEARRDAELENSDLAKAYNNTIKNHLAQLKHMKDKNWTGLKQGIRLVAFDLPKFEAVVNDAKNVVGGTKAKFLNVNTPKVGERRSNKLAMNAMLKQDQEVALREKQNAAMNAALAQQTHIAIGKVNNAFAFLSRLGTRRNQAILKEAGPSFQKAANDLASLFTFSRSAKADISLENYQKYAKEQVEQGNGDHAIPPEVLQWLDTIESGKDMTVDQIIYTTNLMRSVMKQAKMKNQMMGEYKKNQLQMSEDLVADTAVKDLATHPDSKDSNLVEIPGDSETPTEKAARYTDTFLTSITNNQFISTQLDQEIKNGLWSKLVWQAIAGVGAHEGPYGLAAKTKWQFQFKTNLDTAVKKYGKKDFINLGRVELDIVEFRGNPLLKNGKLTKSELLTMQMGMGNDENITRMTNYDATPELLRTVTEKYLDQRDFDFVQEAVWDIYRKVGPLLQDLEHKTNGTELELTVPQPFTAFGKVYAGGHMPIKYKKNSSIDQIVDMIHKRQGRDESRKTYVPVNSKEGIVRSPHTEMRKGSGWLVDLSYSTLGIGFEEVIHDMTMRIPVRDTTKFLTRPDVATAITKVIGPRRYSVYVDSVAEQTNSMSAENGLLYTSNSIAIKGFVKSVEGSVATGFIALNPGSVVMATLGMPQVIRVMGRKGGTHVAAAALKILNPLNYSQMKEMFAYAAELDPSLQASVMGFTEIEAQVVKEGYNAPKTRALKNKPYDLLRSAQERAKHLAFHTILNSVDVMMKFTAAIASSNQFIAGDAPGFPIEKVRAMTPAQLMENVKGYSAQISASSLMTTSSFEKAPIQKTTAGGMATNFWNERRSVHGTTASVTRQLKHNAQRMVTKAKSGDYVGANLELSNSMGLGTRSMLAALFSSYVIQIAREMFETEKQEERREGEEEKVTERGAVITGRNLMVGAINEMAIAPMPLLGELSYNIGVKGARVGRGVSMPFFAGMTAVAHTGLVAVEQMGELQILDAEEELSERDFKQMMMAVSIFTQGIPVNGPMKFYKKYHDGEDFESTAAMGSIAAPLAAVLVPPPVWGALAVGSMSVLAAVAGYDYFIEKYDKSKDPEGMSEDEPYPMTDEELEEEYQKNLKREPQSVIQQAVDQSKTMRAQLLPASEVEPITSDGYDSMVVALSEGDWSKVGINGETGMYQFTEEKWDSIMNDPKARKLNLTENGRVSKDQTQQQRAMKFESTKNAAILAKQEIAVNLETLLYAHMFGIKDAKKVWTGSPKTKLSKEMKADPRLKEAKVKNAGDMRKYIEGLL